MSSDTREYAKLYIAKGWYVFPVDGKVPLTKNGLKDASIDPAVIDLWWGPGGKTKSAGIAIRTGTISGLVVVDIDQKSGGLESYEKMKDKFPITPKVRTGGGGYHLYYSHSGGEVKNSASKVAPGIDIRGDQGYVVAPPSPHESGNTYVWEVLPSQTPCAPFPSDVIPKATTFEAADLRTPGKRNTAVTQVVGSFKRLGLSDEAMSAAIRAENTGLSDDEIAGIIQHSKRWPAAHPARHEIGQAQLIKFLYDDSICYDKVRQTWLAWDGLRWRTTTDVYTQVKDAADRVEQEAKKALDAAVLAKDKEAKEDAEAWCKWGTSLHSGRSVSAVTPLTQLEVGKSMELDAQPYLLGVKNGVIDLSNGTLLAGIPSQWITKMTKVVYDPTATCPRWERFLIEIFRDRDGNDRPDLVDWVHRAIGYSATGDVSRQCWFLCLGEGSNGKGTFLGTVKAVLGEYGQKLSVKTITTRGSRRSTDDDVANLAGARFLLSGEAGVSAELDSERIKDLVGSDTDVRASRIYKDEMEFKMQGKIWMPNNHKPHSNDDSHGFWRRVHRIPFDRQFTIDPTLQPLLDSEQEGILTWIVRGAAEYIQRGLEPPDIIKAETKDLRDSNDPLKEWYDTLILDPSARMRADDAYKSYQGWCSDTNRPERERIGRRRVGEYMERKHFRGHDTKGNYYQGVREREDADDLPTAADVSKTGGEQSVGDVPSA